MELSSAITKLTETVEQERAKTVPFTKWAMNKDFINSRDLIVERHRSLDEEDLKYLEYILEKIRSNKGMFNQEKDKRARYFKAKYSRPKIVLIKNEEDLVG